MTFDDSVEITHILVVKDIEVSKKWYLEVMDAEFYNEYGGTSLVIKLFGNWFLLVTGGEPTKDKPTVTFKEPVDLNTVSSAFTIKVKDLYKTYESLKDKGAEFLTEPVEYDFEIRAFFRDPDGHLFEISQNKQQN